jgi:hypothetical protein
LTTICVSLQLVAVAAVTPLNFTVLDPTSVAPKPEPVIVTDVPTEPDVGEIDVISGPQRTGVYNSAEEVFPPGPTKTLPVGRSVALKTYPRGDCMEVVTKKLPFAGAYISAEESSAKPAPKPPAINTSPVGSKVAVGCSRAVTSDPVLLKNPVGGS